MAYELSIPDIKEISSDKFWDIFGQQGSWYTKTINHEKLAEAIHNLDHARKISQWMLGRIVVEIKTKIQHEFEQWDYDYYKDPTKKPEYTSAEKWFNDHERLTGCSYRQAKRYEWLYLYTSIEDSKLGYKKNKMIEDLLGKDEDIKKKFRDFIKKENLNEKEVEEYLRIFVEKLIDDAADDSIKVKAFAEIAKKRLLSEIEKIHDLKKKDEIKIKIIETDGKNVIIRCDTVKNAELIRDAIIDLEPTIKMKAFKKK